MNCLDVRRQILSNPVAVSSGARSHLHACPSCADFATRTLALDEELADALAVPVPSALTRRIVAEALRSEGWQRRKFVALTASAAIAAVIGAGLVWSERDDPMALAGIDFVVEEEANAILFSSPPDPAMLRRVADVLRIDFPQQLGEIRYVGTCPFRGSIAHHIVATTPQGKVTLLLLPDQPVPGPRSASARGLRARVRPAGHGSIAMIAESDRSLQRVEQMIRSG